MPIVRDAASTSSVLGTSCARMIGNSENCCSNSVMVSGAMFGLADWRTGIAYLFEAVDDWQNDCWRGFVRRRWRLSNAVAKLANFNRTDRSELYRDASNATCDKHHERRFLFDLRYLRS